MSIFNFDCAIVRRPGRSVTNALRNGAHEPPSFEDVVSEHDAYCSALEDAGLNVSVLPANEAFPDGLFVEDPALVFSEGAILLKSASDSRANEIQDLAPTLREKFDRVLSLGDGHVEGGDVLVTPEQVLIGLSERTDLKGAKALQKCLDAFGLRSSITETPKGVLHLKTACSLLDEETILITRDLAESDAFASFKKLIVPEEEALAANILRLNDRVLAGQDYPRTLDLIVRHGFTVDPLPTSAINKIDAGLSCMSLRWRA